MLSIAFTLLIGLPHGVQLPDYVGPPCERKFLNGEPFGGHQSE
jgi:hypothetical protein